MTCLLRLANHFTKLHSSRSLHIRLKHAAPKPLNPVRVPIHYLSDEQLATPDAAALINAEYEQPPKPRHVDVAVIGAVNSGKSTFLNQFLKRQWTATSPLVHMTRENLAGILTEGDLQMVAWDTPGLMLPSEKMKYNFGRRHVTSAAGALSLAEVAVIIMDVHQIFNYGLMDNSKDIPRRWDRRWKGVLKEVSLLEELKSPNVYLAFNKIDLIRDSRIEKIDQLAKTVIHYAKAHCNVDVAGWFPVSALTGFNVDAVRKACEAHAIEGPWEYNPHLQTNISPQKLVTEVIREELFRSFGHEIPYSVGHETISFVRKNRNGVNIQTNVPEGSVNVVDERKTSSLHVVHHLYVSRNSQLRLLVGRQGSAIKNLRMAASFALSQAFRVSTYCEVQVVVDKKKLRETTTENRM